MLAHLLMMAATLPGGSPWMDGTLVVLHDSNRIVETATNSRITHVGILLNDNDRPYVFEATPGAVRRVALPDYLTEIARLNQRRSQAITVSLSRPVRRFDELDTRAMRAHLGTELGRRYSVKPYVRRRPSDGVHCSQLVASTLNRSSRYALAEAHRIAPGKLVDQLLVHDPHPYRRPIALRRFEQQTAPISTVEQTQDCWDGFKNWCGWACMETWLFCR